MGKKAVAGDRGNLGLVAVALKHLLTEREKVE
jgi:hypothetical protein